MIDYATRVVDPIADDDWADVCIDLMPTFRERRRLEQERLEQERHEQELRDQEEARRAEEDRIAEEERAALHALRERQRQERGQRVTRQRNREQQEKDSGHLSPTSSRVVAKRKSGSSVGESGSGDKPEVPPEPKEKGKGKGKARAPEESADLKDPSLLPVGSISVSRFFIFYFILSRLPPLSYVSL
jgi:hypothetical protein